MAAHRVTWPLLQAQFGPDFSRLRKFREKFLIALKQVALVYSAARIEADDEGLLLRSSPPCTQNLHSHRPQAGS
jgi:hypothetical protein